MTMNTFSSSATPWRSRGTPAHTKPSCGPGVGLALRGIVKTGKDGNAASSFPFGGDPKGRAARPEACVHPAVSIHMDTGKPLVKPPCNWAGAVSYEWRFRPLFREQDCCS